MTNPHSPALIDDRIIELEIKISYQEVQVEELRKLVDEQQITIDKMEKALKEIVDKMTSDENSANPEHVRPPHY